MKGFVDLQVNGYGGVDFSAPDLDIGKVGSVVRALRRRGTIAFCPTIITSPAEIYEGNLPVLARAMDDPILGPHLLGVHLEGPFISDKEGARGAHQGRHARIPDVTYYEHLRHLAKDRISLVTLAPELAGADALIQHIVECGTVVSLGHHLAESSTIARACELGATAATHLGNGLPNLLPRHPNPIWDQLDEARLQAMLITDGHHLPDSFIRVATRALGAQRMIVVSDSAPIAGLPPGQYRTLGQNVILEENGRLWNPAEDHLVGSSACLMTCMNDLAKLKLLKEEELRQVGHHNPLALIGKRLQGTRLTGFPDVLYQDGTFVLASD